MNQVSRKALCGGREDYPRDPMQLKERFATGETCRNHPVRLRWPEGAISHEHLESYLDEFNLRFRRRTSRFRGKLFLRLLEQAAAAARIGSDRLNKHSRPQPERPCRRALHPT